MCCMCASFGNNGDSKKAVKPKYGSNYMHYMAHLKAIQSSWRVWQDFADGSLLQRYGNARRESDRFQRVC